MELDFRTVKALSSPVRLKILRNVLENESTPTSISRDLDRSKSTISSHLDKLMEAGLVTKDEEEGRKRVIYRPTEKAEAIVSGKERQVKFTVASSVFAAVAGFSSVASWFTGVSSEEAMTTQDSMTAMSQEAASTASGDPSMLSALSPDLLLYIGGFMLLLSATGFVYGWTLNYLGSE